MSPKLVNRRIRLLFVILTIAFAATLARAAWLQGVRAEQPPALVELSRPSSLAPRNVEWDSGRVRRSLLQGEHGRCQCERAGSDEENRPMSATSKERAPFGAWGVALKRPVPKTP